MKSARCHALRFAAVRASFPPAKKTFRAILAVTLVGLMLVPQPSLAQTQTYSCPTAFGAVGA
ncbi:MAG TPA: hypothetical protein VFW31_12530, partial [Candidatus Angelobacter sp.]|nr:hypothetical protein [Candidatus Angelobacter sp.]